MRSKFRIFLRLRIGIKQHKVKVVGKNKERYPFNNKQPIPIDDDEEKYEKHQIHNLIFK